ncbi:MAG: hypothetical protein ACLSC9_12010 [Barnesiella sp.]
MENENPWLGLKTYKEGQILYGRSEEIRLLSQNIITNVQTIIYGKSGIGKSSILNAGVFPIARHANLFPVDIRLVHNDIPYIAQIKKRVIECLDNLRKEHLDDLGNKQFKKTKGSIEELVPVIRPGEESLWEFFHRHIFRDEKNERIFPLIVIDQFEEIFTLEKDRNKISRFFDELADLLNGIVPDYILQSQPSDYNNEKVKETDGSDTYCIEDLLQGIDLEEPITTKYLPHSDFHLVLSLREDFLSYLERNITHIPVLKQNRYCLQPINEEQAATIITDPIPGLIDKKVAKQIIIKVTGDSSFELDGKPEIQVDSAMLSLFLSELYKKKDTSTNYISSELVDKFGGNIIQSFYEESMSKISRSSADYLEDSLLNDEGRRENISLYNALKSGVKEEELDILEDQRLIRRYAWGNSIRIEFIHDILCKVAGERREKRQLLKKQEETRLKQEAAQRRILEEEKRKREKIEKEAEREKIRSRKRIRNLLIGIVSILFLVSGGLFLYWYAYEKTESEYYLSFTKVQGWPQGIGKQLDEKERSIFGTYYRLSRQGHWQKHFTRAEIMNAYGETTTNKSYHIPLVSLHEDISDNDAYRFADLLRKISYWRYEPDNKGNVAKEIAYGKDNSILYVLSYFQSINDISQSFNKVKNEPFISDNNESGTKQIWTIYMDKYGKPLKVRSNGANRMRISMDEAGHEVKYMFFDESGSPKDNYEKVYGYTYTIDSLTHITGKRTNIDQYGYPLTVKGYDCIEYTDFDKYGQWKKCEYRNNDRMVNNEDGYAYEEREQENNQTTRRFYNAEQKPVLATGQHGSIIINKQDRSGNDTLVCFYDIDGQPVSTHRKGDYSRIVYRYGNHEENLLNETRYRLIDGKEKAIYSQTNTFGKDGKLLLDIVTIDADNDSLPYLNEKKKYNNGDLCEIAYYGKNNQPVMYNGYHKYVIDKDTLPDKKISVVTQFLDTGLKLYCSDNTGDYAMDSCIYSTGNNLLSRTLYNKNNEIIFSYLYEYDELGELISQSVMGIDGSPVRYAPWDVDGLYYYKIRYIKDFSGKFEYLKGINEFGEEAYVYCKQNGNWTDMKIQNGKPQVSPLSNAPQAMTIRLESKNGTAYKSGLKDGDILIGIGSWKFSFKNPDNSRLYSELQNLKHSSRTVTAVRHDPVKKTSRIIECKPAAGALRAEVYPIYYTEKEKERLEKIIKPL